MLHKVPSRHNVCRRAHRIKLWSHHIQVGTSFFGIVFAVHDLRTTITLSIPRKWLTVLCITNLFWLRREYVSHGRSIHDHNTRIRTCQLVLQTYNYLLNYAINKHGLVLKEQLASGVSFKIDQAYMSKLKRKIQKLLNILIKLEKNRKSLINIWM